MLDSLKANLNILIVAASLGLGVIYGQAGDAGGCGAGCQRSMGSCTVNSALWASLTAARESGIRATSCCRSKEYNTRMRSCGYFPSPSSAHMSGNAVDIIVSPNRCNSRNLAQYGFNNVCPHYHYGHCHVSQCGTPRTNQASIERVERKAIKIRRKHRSQRTAQKISPVRRQESPVPGSQGFLFDVGPSWWEAIDVGVEQ